MKNSRGFSSFEFYFVMAVIGLVLLAGIHAYNTLAKEAQRLSFEALAHNFSAAVYGERIRWIISQPNPDSPLILEGEGRDLFFSQTGWPIAVDRKNLAAEVSVAGCASLWYAFLPKAPALDGTADQLGGTSAYSVVLTPHHTCRYEWQTPHQGRFHFEYVPHTGETKINQ